MESRDVTTEDCDFCEIIQNPSDTQILLSDDELLCFQDFKPGAAHHYLVITRTHLDSCKNLQSDHIGLVEQMVEMGKMILEKNKVSDLEDVRMGFHLPPFTSVPHLHLHVLSPVSQMTSKSLIRYGPLSHWFITVDKVLSQLRTSGKVK
ncbi:adenosine 5'-monophosphoramidase HINT3-like [Genypterus blacodes]|uniref:adenosine 5'-monophosphoramidase HINT3-like n=1 Tax=Genypterus blacodes TaxID=154954 RepID=UPI003F77670C